jgi:hypothetical protein
MYRLFISEAVVEEASRGDVEASRRRLEALSGLEELAIDEPAIGLAEKSPRMGRRGVGLVV